MLRCDDKDVCHSKIINKTLQNVIKYENNNKYRQNPKIQLKIARRMRRSQLNHKFFSEKLFLRSIERLLKANGNYQYLDNVTKFQKEQKLRI